MGCAASKEPQFITAPAANGVTDTQPAYYYTDEPTAYDHESSLARDVLRLPGDVFKKLSSVVRPTEVGRNSAFVNVNGVATRAISNVSSSSASYGFRRMNSVSAVSPVTGTDLKWTASRNDLEREINAEKARTDLRGSPHAAPDDLKTEERRLAERLAKLKLDMHVMGGDGSCQFRSVSFNLYGTEEHHMLVRRRATQHMRLHAAEYEPFLGDAAGWTRYIADMEQAGNWGDELTLRAICDSYGIVFNVITSDQHHWFLRYTPKELKDYGGGPKEIFLTYIAPCHYNAIRRRTSSLPRIFALSRSTSSIEAALRQAERQGLPRDQVSIPPPASGAALAADAHATTAHPMAIPATVLERDSNSFGEGGASPGVAVSPNGIASPFAVYQPPLVEVR